MKNLLRFVSALTTGAVALLFLVLATAVFLFFRGGRVDVPKIISIWGAEESGSKAVYLVPHFSGLAVLCCVLALASLGVRRASRRAGE